MLSQTTAITSLNLKSIPERWGASLVIVVGEGGGGEREACGQSKGDRGLAHGVPYWPRERTSRGGAA